MAGESRRALIHLDTHVVCWLYDGLVERLSPTAREAMSSGRLAVSPMVELEIAYLREIGRFRDEPASVLGALAASLGLAVSQTPFSLVVARALELDWTRDVFDRMIVAQALADDALLVTKDGRVREHFDRACW